MPSDSFNIRIDLVVLQANSAELTCKTMEIALFIQKLRFIYGFMAFHENSSALPNSCAVHDQF